MNYTQQFVDNIFDIYVKSLDKIKELEAKLERNKIFNEEEW